ncbi:MAG: hypothetical protein EOP61_06625 [Sphingomonadales bacterium]|nr:MAG: hypothetical protein EOP61_06625 [Sphingomonadales bacterium]
MRHAIPVLTLALALAACSTADNAAQQIGNAAEETGDALANAGDGLASATGNAVEGVGNAARDATAGHDAWLGRWTGVEGTYLVISKAALPDRYRLEMQYTLDSKGSFDGAGTKEGITFTRPDGKQLLRASNGDATGLKYLAGKKDCLTVKDGEGYCRD